MRDEEYTLPKLKKIFLYAHRNEFYYRILENIYDIYEEEFIILFNEFYNDLINTFDPKKKEGIEENLFQYDLMQNVCNIIYYSLGIYKHGYETEMLSREEKEAIALIHFKTEKEKLEKQSKLELLANQKGISFYVFYLDRSRIKFEIESLFLLPKILLSMSSTNTSIVTENYKSRLDEKNKLISFMEDNASHGLKFKGGKLTEENKLMYEAILNIHLELVQQHGKGHKSSLTKATAIYLKGIGVKYPNQNEIKNISARIGRLKKQGRIHKNKII